jgi:hypothetical protein
VAHTVELASFRGDDEPRLVRAALACPMCLSGQVEWSLELDEVGAEVDCACRDCGHHRVVTLNTQQALRLYLHRQNPLPA